MRPVRCFFDMLIRYRSGLSSAMCRADGLREGLGFLPSQSAVGLDLQRRDDVQALAAGRLAEGDEPERFEALAHLLGGVDHGREGDVGSRIEIEHEATRQRGMVRLAIPGVEFHGGDLGHGDQPFDAIDLQIGLAVALDGRQLDQVGDARHGVALEELLAIDAIGRADDGARPSLEMLDHPGTDLFEIGREIALGDRLPSLLGRPQRLVGVGYAHAHNDGAGLG